MNKYNIAIDKPIASILLPTYNRLETLKLVLFSLENQTVSGDLFEIIVTDDYSNDGTREFLNSYRRKNNKLFKYTLSEKNSGPAHARNLALEKTIGEIVIIIGDDIVVEHNFIEGHINWHSIHSNVEEAVLGHVAWPVSISPSRFMKWLYNGGRDFFFNFSSFQSGEQINSQNFYTCNVSVKRKLINSQLFDESFAYASHEDLEFGNRLGRSGMKLFYCSDILAYHHHYLKIEAIVKRVYVMGRSAHVFWQKVPDNCHFSKKAARIILIKCASSSLVYRGLMRLLRYKESNDCDYPVRWSLILTMSYWLGLADAKNGTGMRTFQENIER